MPLFEGDSAPKSPMTLYSYSFAMLEKRLGSLGPMTDLPEALVEYRRLMALRGVAPQRVLAPPRLRGVWAKHMVLLKDYTEFCRVAAKELPESDFDAFRCHDEEAEMHLDIGEIEAAGGFLALRAARAEHTRVLYCERFLCEPPRAFWNYAELLAEPRAVKPSPTEEAKSPAVATRSHHEVPPLTPMQMPGGVARSARQLGAEPIGAARHSSGGSEGALGDRSINADAPEPAWDEGPVGDDASVGAAATGNFVGSASDGGEPAEDPTKPPTGAPCEDPTEDASEDARLHEPTRSADPTGLDETQREFPESEPMDAVDPSSSTAKPRATVVADVAGFAQRRSSCGETGILDSPSRGRHVDQRCPDRPDKRIGRKRGSKTRQRAPAASSALAATKRQRAARAQAGPANRSRKPWHMGKMSQEEAVEALRQVDAELKHHQPSEIVMTNLKIMRRDMKGIWWKGRVKHQDLENPGYWFVLVHEDNLLYAEKFIDDHMVDVPTTTSPPWAWCLDWRDVQRGEDEPDKTGRFGCSVDKETEDEHKMASDGGRIVNAI